MASRVRAFLELMRPANIVTAVADILAGAAVAGTFALGRPVDADLLWLILATIGLYGGGVVFNDIFDVALDRVERPERALPSGRISLRAAIIGGLALLGVGVACGLAVSLLSGLIALLVAVGALLYDKFAKHSIWAGPLVMGACRGGNLLLGVSLSVAALTQYWYLALIPVVFIANITLTSQGEVHGDNRPALRLALGVDVLIVASYVVLGQFSDFQLLPALPFLLLWWAMNSVTKWQALRDNQPAMIGRAVKFGVLSLIPLNAALAAGFMGLGAGVVVLALLPVSLVLARVFAVT